MDIYVDPSQLRLKGSEINLLNTELKGIMDEIEQLVLSVSGVWQSNAERAFAEKIIYLKKQFSGVSLFFEDYSELLKNFACSYEQQEKELVSKIDLT